MSDWIEVKEKYKKDDAEKFLLNLNTVTYIYTDYICDCYSVIFRIADGTEFEKSCKSELEAQMIYAKLKKILCKNEELNELI